MKRHAIDPADLCINIVPLWAEQWFLLTAGMNAPGKYNSMTVAWGSLGVMWAKPFAQIVVRPSRFTHEFTEQHATFTLCAFPPEYKSALTLCGTKSGRDIDKVKTTGLTPIASETVEAPGYDEAELIIECRKIYWSVFDSAQFLDDTIESNYNGTDYHTVYFGEILHISATDKYERTIA